MKGNSVSYYYKDANRQYWSFVVKRNGEFSYQNEFAEDRDFHWNWDAYKSDVGFDYEEHGNTQILVSQGVIVGQSDIPPSILDVLKEFANAMMALVIGASKYASKHEKSDENHE